MPKFDLTISISVIVALCAIVSPIFTAIINNRYQIKIKRLELSRQEYSDSVLYRRNIYENYLKHAGRCIYHSDLDALKDYGEFYYAALMYAPDDLQKDMISANSLILEEKYNDAAPTIEVIATKIYLLQQKA